MQFVIRIQALEMLTFPSSSYNVLNSAPLFHQVTYQKSLAMVTRFQARKKPDNVRSDQNIYNEKGLTIHGGLLFNLESLFCPC